MNLETFTKKMNFFSKSVHCTKRQYANCWMPKKQLDVDFLVSPHFLV